jgi:hypothetical protein
MKKRTRKEGEVKEERGNMYKRKNEDLKGKINAKGTKKKKKSV